MSFNLRWLGTSCFQLVLSENVHILLDPHMDHSPNCPLTSDQIEHCDYMFLTHGHWDHVLDVGKLAERLRPPIFCNQETAAAIVEHQQVDKTLINVVTTTDIIERPGVITEVLPGVHVDAAREYKRQTGMDLPSEEAFADPLERLRAIMRATSGTDQFPDAYPRWREIYKGGEQLNFVFEGSDGQRLYVAGTYPDPSVVAAAEKVRASVTLLQCMSANKLAGIEQETADLAIASGCKTVVPQHHDPLHMGGLTTDLSRLRQILSAQSSIHFMEMEPGRWYSFENGVGHKAESV